MLRELAGSVLTRAPEIARGLRTRVKLRNCASLGQGVEVRGRVVVHGKGRVVIGDRVVLDGVLAPIELLAGPEGEILIGSDVHVGPGVSLEARKCISVGARSRLGPFAKLLDNHLHRVDGNRNSRPASTPVVLEEEVLVGARAVILPGARLGRGCTVGAATVVSRPVPAGRMIRGAPPRIVDEAGQTQPR